MAPSAPTTVTTRSVPTQVDHLPTVVEPFLAPRAGLATDGAAPLHTVGPGILYGACPVAV